MDERRGASGTRSGDEAARPGVPDAVAAVAGGRSLQTGHG
jgi:hypothetical protein